MLLCLFFLVLACIPLPRFSFKGREPLPATILPTYTLQPGDEVIAAEVFKVPKETKTGIPDKPVMTSISLPTSTPTSTPYNWPLILSTIYVGGLLGCTLYTLLGHLLIHRLVICSIPAEPALLDSVSRGNIRLRICEDCDRPLSFGLLRPTILLPAGFTHLDGAKQRHILLHEMAHISQRDAFGHFLFNLMFPILYFHPLYWLLRRKTNLARELIADDWAAAQSSRESYVADLLALAKERFGRAALSTQALGLFHSKTDLYRRMHMLMQTNRPLARRCSIYWRLSYSTLLIVALVLASGTFGLRRANAQADNGQQKVAEQKLAEEQALAAQRQAELVKLRAEQDQIRAQLDVLEAEKQKLQAELERRKADGAGADVAAIYKRAIAQDAVVLAGQNEKRLGEREKAEKDEKQALKDWITKKNPAGNREQNEFPGRAQLDLVSLANSYVDAIGNFQIQELELQRLSGKPNVFTPDEINRAKIQVNIAQRKVQIFRAIAEAAMESAKADLDIAKHEFDTGIAPKNAYFEAKSRLKILEVILAQ